MTDGSAIPDGDNPPGAPTPADLAAVSAQLGRPVRSVVAVAHRCPCGLPDVVITAPRLDDGTPFPTTFYLTCPRAASKVGSCESGGLMHELGRQLTTDPQLAEQMAEAHHDYLARRRELGEVPEIAGISAGGMPDRVKCLHAMLGHALAAGPGVNPIGDLVAERVGPWWQGGPCVQVNPVQVNPVQVEPG